MLMLMDGPYDVVAKVLHLDGDDAKRSFAGEPERGRKEGRKGD